MRNCREGTIRPGLGIAHRDSSTLRSRGESDLANSDEQLAYSIGAALNQLFPFWLSWLSVASFAPLESLLDQARMKHRSKQAHPFLTQVIVEVFWGPNARVIDLWGVIRA